MGGGRSVGGDGCPGATALRLRLRSVAPGHPWVGWLYLKPPSFLSRHWGGVYHDHFPELAERETRSVTVPAHSDVGLPPGEYGFLEMFCDEPGCDCRRVMFYVVSPGRKDELAVVAYGWESTDFYARWLKLDDPLMLAEMKGPVLNMGSPQSDLGPAILGLVRDVLLEDTAYVQRVKRHYKMFREPEGIKLRTIK